MNINLRLYRSLIPSVQSVIKNNPHCSDDEIITLSSVGTGAHIVACAYFVGYVKGHRDFYKEKVDKLKSFYKIDVVENLEDFFYDDGRIKENIGSD